MSGLLVHNMFDGYLVREVDISTLCDFHIDGRINKNWFGTDELEAMNGRTLSKWSEIKPLAYQLIKGNKTPLAFKMVFMVSEEQKTALLTGSGLRYKEEDISGMFLNIKYEKGELNVITGTSMNLFTLDKAVDQFWDDKVRQVFTQSKIAYEEV